MAFACPHCGRPIAGTGGRARTVRCACGQTLVIGPSAPASPPGASRLPPLPGRAAPPAAPSWDPVAARLGVLIEGPRPPALAVPHPLLVPEVDHADVEALEPSPGEPAPATGEPRRRPGRAARPRRARRAAAILALLLGAGGAAWFLVNHPPAGLPPAVAGVLDRLRPGERGRGAAEVASALETSARSLRACVQAAERGPRKFRLAGRRVTLRVTATPSGRVTAPRIEEADLDRSPAGACLRSAARHMVFPPRPGGPVEVRIPLDLAGPG